MSEIGFVLDSVDVASEDAFRFFKRLSTSVYQLKDLGAGYDQTKRLAGFLWMVFSGWDPEKGYRDHDIVESMLKRI